MRRAILLLVALCVGSVHAQEPGEPPAPTRSALVELTFRGSAEDSFTVEKGAVNRVERSVAKQYGIPQMAVLFIEVVAPVEGSSERVVQYAAAVADPRFHTAESRTEDGQLVGQRVFSSSGTLELCLPDLPGAELILYERMGSRKSGQPSRRELFRTGY